MKYYYIENRYEGHNKGSGHVVKANSEKEAAEICEKHGIANPMGTKVKSRTVTLIRVNSKDFIRSLLGQSLINRRKKGIGGKIFYEQDNQLKIEKN